MSGKVSDVVAVIRSECDAWCFSHGFMFSDAFVWGREFSVHYRRGDMLLQFRGEVPDRLTLVFRKVTLGSDGEHVAGYWDDEHTYLGVSRLVRYRSENGLAKFKQIAKGRKIGRPEVLRSFLREWFALIEAEASDIVVGDYSAFSEYSNWALSQKGLGI